MTETAIEITTEATEATIPPPTPSMKRKPKATKPKPQTAMIAEADRAALASVFAPREEQKETKFGFSAKRDKRSQKITAILANYHTAGAFSHVPIDRARYNLLITDFGADTKSSGMKSLGEKLGIAEKLTAEIAAGVDVAAKYGLKF